MTFRNQKNYSRTVFALLSIISMTEDSSPNSSIPTYSEWDNVDVILSSFFWGYIVPQVGAGQLSEYFGPQWFLVATMIIGSVFYIAIPAMAAAFGSTGIIVCRILQGLNQGFLYPSTHNLISRWTPIYERSSIMSFVYSSTNVGIAGWPGSFYLYGALGIAWAIIFAIFASNVPAQHKSISEEERKYIESTTDVTATVKKVPTPWKSIFTSLPLWAIFISGIGLCFAGFTLLTEIPSYMNGMMDFDIDSNSQLSALPYLVEFILSLTVTPLFDYITNKKILSITAARKVSNGISCFVPAAALIFLAFLEDFHDQKDLVVGLLVVAVATGAFAQTGGLVNIIDLAPNHSGTLLGVINGGNNVFSILAPLVVGFFGNDKKNRFLWMKVFLLSAGLSLAGGIFYTVFASAEVQSWNDKEKSDREKDNKVENDK